MTEEEEITLRSACREEIIGAVNKINNILRQVESQVDFLVYPKLYCLKGKFFSDGASVHKKVIKGQLIYLTGAVGEFNDSLEKLPENLLTDSEVLSHGFEGSTSSSEEGFGVDH